MSPTPASTRRLLVATALGGALWIGLLVGLAPWDLQLSQALAEPDGFFSLAIARWGEWPTWTWTALCLVFLVLGRRVQELRAPARATVLLALVHPLVLTQSLKQLWGRVRPRHLSPDLLDYTPFFEPAGVGAGESFPSGHAAAASVLLPLALWLWRRGGAQRGLALMVVAWVLTVGVGRVVAEAHFPTDVVFSLGVGALLTPWLLRRRPAPQAPTAG